MSRWLAKRHGAGHLALLVSDSPSPWYEAAFGAHYPLLYQHRDDVEARQCLKLLPHLGPVSGGPGEEILDLGCGDGRHLQWLQQAGTPAVGLDLSAHLLAAAAVRRGARGGGLVRGDMRCLPFGAESFCTVLSLFTAFGYFGPPAANLQPIMEVARVLRPGGHWFLDYFDGDVVRAELGDGQPRTRERQIDCLLVREVRCYLQKTSQVTKEVELAAVPGREVEAAAIGVGPTGVRYTEQVAVFTLAELDELAQGAGLARVAGAGDYHGVAIGEGSRWILVYKKECAAVR